MKHLFEIEVDGNLLYHASKNTIKLVLKTYVTYCDEQLKKGLIKGKMAISKKTEETKERRVQNDIKGNLAWGRS